ncbi:MAG: hypothetical protein ABGW50_02030 [Thermococcus sp.]
MPARRRRIPGLSGSARKSLADFMKTKPTPITDKYARALAEEYDKMRQGQEPDDARIIESFVKLYRYLNRSAERFMDMATVNRAVIVFSDKVAIKLMLINALVKPKCFSNDLAADISLGKLFAERLIPKLTPHPARYLSIENFVKLAIHNYLVACGIIKYPATPFTHDWRRFLPLAAGYWLKSKLGCPLRLTDLITKLKTTRKAPRREYYACPVCGLIRSDRTLKRHLYTHFYEILEMLREDGVLDAVYQVNGATLFGELDIYLTLYNPTVFDGDIESKLTATLLKHKEVMEKIIKPIQEALGNVRTEGKSNDKPSPQGESDKADG